ncbi:glycosyltransferase family 2 protein [Trinickia acidisoli]|uniref:glycosyltransferase family 2 protein n=1 Tax=Trinickia acidisoli TaxID=2767482 RepID=UPI001A8E1E4B|nr:glycosyltransferase family 2 protein [Trinickia acidisoli]
MSIPRPQSNERRASHANRATLSVIVVAMNEAHDIRDCLESVRGLARETIVFDSGSTDGTPDICRELGARVFETDWPGDGPQKNRALAQATGDWVLCLDADERVGDELRREIERLLEEGSTHAVFSTPRRSSFCGRFMRHSGWWPDRIERLFRRGSARFTDVRTHTHLVVDGTTGRFDGPIIHIAIGDLHEALDKANSYSTSGALTMAENGKHSSLGKAIGKGLWAFVRTYVLRRGFLDGRMGFMLAVANAEGTYYRYAKLALLGERQASTQRQPHEA